MRNFEKFEFALKTLGANLERVDFEEAYMYVLDQRYENEMITWGIRIGKENTEFADKHYLSVHLLKIPKQKKQLFLILLNRLNQMFFNVNFQIVNYDEDQDIYEIILYRYYYCFASDFNGAFYLKLVQETNQLLQKVLPEMVNLKY